MAQKRGNYMQKMRFIGIVFIILWLQGCVQGTYERQSSALIVMKTPTFKYADMGFIYQNSDVMKVEVYSSGKAVMALKLYEDQICMSTLECMNPERFNEQILSQHYPKTLLKDIFEGKTIFEKEGYQQSRNGFTQNIFQNGKYDIDYSVLNREIVFRDTINKILIKIKEQG